MGTFALLALVVAGAVGCVALAARARRGTAAAESIVAVVCLAAALVAACTVDWHAGRVRLWPTDWLIDEVRLGRADFVVADELDRRVQAQTIVGDARDRVVRAFWQITATPRSSVRAGERLSVATEVVPVASMPIGDGRAKDAPFAIYWRMTGFRIGEGPWQDCADSWHRRPLLTNFSETEALAVPREFAPGETTIDLMYSVRLVDRGKQPASVDAKTGSPEVREYRADDPSTFAWQQTIRVKTTVGDPTTAPTR